MNEPASSDLLAILIRRAEIHDNHFRRSLLRLDEIMVLAFTILAGATTLVFYQKLWALGFVLPLIFQTAVFLAVENAGEMSALAAYRDFIDRQVADLINRGSKGSETTIFMPWERVAGQLRFGSVASTMLIFLYGLAVSFGGIGMLIVAWQRTRGDAWLGIPLTVLTGINYIFVLAAAHEVLATYGQVQASMSQELSRNGIQSLSLESATFPGTQFGRIIYWITHTVAPAPSLPLGVPGDVSDEANQG